jgi:hypothetical protein
MELPMMRELYLCGLQEIPLPFLAFSFTVHSEPIYEQAFVNLSFNHSSMLTIFAYLCENDSNDSEDDSL